MDVRYILFTDLANVCIKIADIKLQHSQVWVLKDNTGYENSSC